MTSWRRRGAPAGQPAEPVATPARAFDARGGERGVFVRESASGVTAVVERNGDRRIRVNNHYSLGGSGAAEYGNLARAAHLVPGGPLNTDRRPVLEYLAPVTQRQQRIGAVDWFHAAELLSFFEDLLSAVPPEHDPYLSRLPAPDHDWIHAGLRHYAAAVHGTPASLE